MARVGSAELASPISTSELFFSLGEEDILDRKIGSERTSESRTKATRRRAEPSRGSARRRAQPSRRSARRRAELTCGYTRPASSTVVWLCSPASSAFTRVGSPCELDLIPACTTYFDSHIFCIAVISDLRDHILLVSF
ncbi:hypothetical protein DY000_02005052 [Brassica cretica]|uniref:Uncharacterized protein n=1 Tax=Brassica cretica TaxID=69181 RepID=A0ABQ7C3J9_BRACR|nr:hypothetical protein DY000_02005052 [Brassica cretica]